MAEHPKSIVPLTNAPNEMVAGIIVAALEREGIQATMTGSASADFRVGVPGEVEILVAAKDLARAEEVLEEADYEEGEDEDGEDEDGEDEDDVDYEDDDDDDDDDEEDDEE